MCGNDNKKLRRSFIRLLLLLSAFPCCCCRMCGGKKGKQQRGGGRSGKKCFYEYTVKACPPLHPASFLPFVCAPLGTPRGRGACACLRVRPCLLLLWRGPMGGEPLARWRGVDCEEGEREMGSHSLEKCASPLKRGAKSGGNPADQSVKFLTRKI